MQVKFRLRGELELDLLKIGLRPGMELTGELQGSNKAIYFDRFFVIDNSCVVWPENYEITQYYPNESKVPDSPFLEVHSVESLFNPDEEEEILVIRVSDLTSHQKAFLNL